MPPPPKSRTCTPSSAGVWVSASASSTVRSAADLPARGPPTTTTWPAASVRSTVRSSWRCRYGRSTTPTGTRRAPQGTGATRPRPGRTTGLPSSSSSGGGASSGGNHTRCAGGPCPAIAVIIASSTVGPPASPESGPAAGAAPTGPTRKRCARRGAGGPCDVRGGGSRTGDVRGPEPHQLAGTRGEERGSGRGRQLVRVRDPQHRARLGGRERAQRDAVGQVRVQAAEPALVQPLRRQQQVHAQRPAQPPDRAQELDELRPLREQLGELVDDHEQRRQRRQVAARGAAHRRVLRRSREVARGAQQLLPPGDLALQGVRHAVDERQFVGQVRDHGGHVRQGGEAEEGRPALEVDEHEVQIGRRVRGHQAEDQRPEEFALARAGGPDAEAVRTAAALGGLLEVQRHRRARLVDADRYAQPVRGTAAVARTQRSDGGGGDRPPTRTGPRRVQPEQLGEACRRGRAGGGARAGGPVAGEATGQRRRLRDGEHVGPPDGRGGARTVHPGEFGRTDEEAHHRRCGPPTGRGTDAEHRRPRDGGPRAGAGRVVDDHEQVRLPRPASGRPAGQLGLPPPPDVVRLRRDHPHRSDGVGGPRVADVREPLDPLPLRRQVGRRHDREQRVGGAVPEHVLRHQCAGQRTDVFGLGARCGLEPDRGGAAERQRDRQLGDHRVRAQEAAQGEGRDRLEPLDGAGLRGDQRGRQPLCTGTHAQQAEVGVRTTALPQPARRDDHGPRRGIRVDVLQGRPLLGGDRPDAPPGRGQVAQVVAPLLVDRRLPLTGAASAAADEQHPDGRQREHAAEEDRRGFARTQGDEGDRAHQHHRREQPGEEPGGNRPLGLGGRLESQLAARHARDDARRPRHLDRAHRTPPSSAKRPRTGPRRGDSRQPYRHFVAVPGNRRRPPSMSGKTICEEAPCPRRPPTAG